MKKRELIKILEYYQNAINWTEMYDFEIKFNELKIKITCKEPNTFFAVYNDDIFYGEDSTTYVFKLNNITLRLILDELKYHNCEISGYSIIRVTANDDTYNILDDNKQLTLKTFTYVILHVIHMKIPLYLLDAKGFVFTVDSRQISLCVKNGFLPCLMTDLFGHYEAKKFADKRIFKCNLRIKMD